MEKFVDICKRQQKWREGKTELIHSQTFLITGILLIYHVLSRFIEKKYNTLLNAMSYWLLCIL